MPGSDNDGDQWDPEFKCSPVKTEIEEQGSPQDVQEGDDLFNFLNAVGIESNAGSSEEGSDWEEEKKKASLRTGSSRNKKETAQAQRRRRRKMSKEAPGKHDKSRKVKTLKNIQKEENEGSDWEPEEEKALHRTGKMTKRVVQTERQRIKRSQMTPEDKVRLRERDRLRKQAERRLKNIEKEDINIQESLVKREDAESDCDSQGKGRGRTSSGKKEEKRLQLDDATVNSDSQTPSRLRPRRQVVVKDEPESEPENEGDEDYDEVQEKPKPPKGNKSRSKRKVKREHSNDEQSLSRTERRRQQLKTMSEEERQALKAKWRDEARARRAQQKKSMTAEERERFLARQRERKKEERRRKKELMVKEGIPIPKRDRKPLTADQKKDQSQRAAVWRIQHRANMTDEERNSYRMKRYMYKVSRIQRMTDEEKEKEREKERAYRREYLKRKRAEKRQVKREAANYVLRDSKVPNDAHRDSETKALRDEYTLEEKNRKRRELQKQKRERLSEEERAKRNQMMRERYYRNRDEARKDPEKLAKWRQKMREGNQRKILRRLEAGSMDWDKRKRLTTRKKMFNWKRTENETKEEKRERLLMSVKMSQKRQNVKKRLEIQQLLASGKSLEEIRDLIEPPEKREQRLINARIRKAKCRLRKTLKASGAPPEEIEKRVNELAHTYQPTNTFRAFKLRKWELKPVQPKELALLNPTVEDGWKFFSTHDSSSPPSPSPEISRSSVPTEETINTTDAPPTKPSSRKRKRQEKSEPLALSSDNQDHFTPIPTTPTSEAETQSHSSSPAHHPVHPLPTNRDQESDQKCTTPQLFGSHHQSNPPHTHSIPIIIQSGVTGYLMEQQQQQQQYTHFQTPLYPHQLPQSQPQPHSLQQYLDCVTHSAVPTTTITITIDPPLPHYQQVEYHPQTQNTPPPNQDTFSSTSSHHDYDSSSYGNQSPLPPPSPAGGDDFHDNDDFIFVPPACPPIKLKSTSTTGAKRGRPPKGTPPKPKVPPSNRPRFGPRGAKPKSSNVVRDFICEECGNSYNRKYIGEHKNQFHNPNFKNGTCQICGEKFTNARIWYRHLIRQHGDPRRVPSADKPIICDECGLSFVSIKNIQQHKYFSHGDGLKIENFKKCPVCPEEKLFKTTVSLYNHFRAVHPGYRRQTNDCYRCEESFPSEPELCMHVKEQHPHSYFPCEHCQSCRFSRMGLNFHHKKCPKVPKEMKMLIRSKEREREIGGDEDGGNNNGRKNEIWSLDEMSAPCEFCLREVKLASMSRHYELVHKVIEDSFRCGECKNEFGKKEFKRRVYWAVHMEEKHEMGWEEMKAMIGKLNVKSRDGLVINNEVGHRWNQVGKGGGGGRRRVKGATDGRRRKKTESGGKWNENVETDESEEENFESGEGEQEVTVKEKGKRRNIVVIAEEDEEATDEAYIAYN